MNTSDQITELAKAMVDVQAEIRAAVKDRVNPHFRSTYADLSGVVDACRSALTKHGFSVIHACRESDGSVLHLDTRLLHKSGQWIEGTLSMRPSKADPQGIGSCITYARRYALAAIVGVVTEDDDGNGASGSSAPARSTPSTAPNANELITDDQLKILNDMLTKCGADIGAFLGVFGVMTLAEMTQAKYAQAMRQIQAKMKKAAKEGAK